MDNAPSDRADLEQLRDYKADIFERWKVEAEPGKVIPYYEGVLQHPTQLKMHFGEDTLVPGRRLICPAAQRAGKSIFAGAEIIAQLGIPRTQLWHCAPTYDLCGKAWAYVWDAVVVQRVHGDCVDRAVNSTDEREIRLRWNDKVSWVRTRSTDPGKGYQQLKGDQLDGISWDECADQPEDVVKRYLLPRLVNRKGWFLAISEPKEFNWFWEYWRRPSKPEFHADGWRSYNFSLAENPFVDPKEIEKLRRSMSTAEAARIIDGHFSSISGQVWPGYRDELFPAGHLYDPAGSQGLPHGFDPSDGPNFRSIDIGLDHPTTCVWLAIDRENDDRYYYHASEHHLDHHDDHAKQIVAETLHPIQSSYIGHDADRGRQAQSGVPSDKPLAIYRKAGVPCRVLGGDPGSISAGVSNIGAMFANTLEANPDGPRIFISRECRLLSEAILRYTYARAGIRKDDPTDRPTKYRDDLAEAFRRTGQVNLRWSPGVTREMVQQSQAQIRRRGRVKGMRGRASVPRF